MESIYRNQVDAIQNALAGLPVNSSAYKVNENKLNKIRTQNLLSFLSENAFLPSAGMPIGLVEFVNNYSRNNNPDNEEGFVRKKAFPTKHISQAISEYAPGNQVVINEWCYKSAGIGLKSPFSTTNRGILQQCSSCKFTTVSLGNPYTDWADIRLPFIVFSEAADKRRIIPRLMATAEDSTRSSNTAAAWCKRLEEDDPCNGIAWREATNAFELATARYGHNSLDRSHMHG